MIGMPWNASYLSLHQTYWGCCCCCCCCAVAATRRRANAAAAAAATLLSASLLGGFIRLNECPWKRGLGRFLIRALRGDIPWMQCSAPQPLAFPFTNCILLWQFLAWVVLQIVLMHSILPNNCCLVVFNIALCTRHWDIAAVFICICILGRLEVEVVVASWASADMLGPRSTIVPSVTALAKFLAFLILDDWPFFRETTHGLSFSPQYPQIPAGPILLCPLKMCVAM